MLKIPFWSKDSGNMLSHKEGLTVENLADLKDLKEGDRLVLWRNTFKDSDVKPSYTLKKFIPKSKGG